MRKNVAAAVITGVSVAIAVIAMGWLLMRGGPAARKGPEPRVEVARRPGPATPAPPPRLPDRRPPAVTAPAKSPSAPPADACKLVDEILREYEGLATDGQSGMIGVAAIENLRERALRIDQIVDRLAAIGAPAVPCLVDHLRADARTQRIDRQTLIVRALAKIPGREAFEALAEALTTTDQWGVKMTIIAQLAEVGGEDGLRLLAQRVEQEPDFRVRAAMLKFLGQKKSPSGMLAAQRLALTDENPNVRTAALRAIGEAGDTGSRHVVEDRARNDPDVSVRQNAIQVYARLFRDGGLAVLEDMLANDANLRIKSVVIIALADMGASDGVRRVLERVANDPNANEEVRARASGALAGLDRNPSGGGLPSPVEPTQTDRPLQPLDTNRKNLKETLIGPVGPK